MYYQSYEDYMKDVLGYPRENSISTYNGYYGMEQRNINMEINDSEIEQLYPEIYRTVYPMVCKACMQYRGEITEDLVTRLTNEVYSNLEIEEFRGEGNSNKEVRNSQQVKNSSKNDNSKQQNETRQRKPDNILKDLIRILIIRELLRRRRRPGRPPFPGNPRPPMPRNQSLYNINSANMQGYYENMY